MPEIGIVGTNDDDMESAALHCSGIIVRKYSQNHSNFRATSSLSELLKKHGTIGICDIDTRYLTKRIRDNGPKMMVASTEISSKDELKKILSSTPRIEEINYMAQVSTKERYTHQFGAWDSEKFCYKTPEGKRKRIVAIDFGVKRNILNELTEAGLEVEVIPYDFDPKELIKRYKSGEIKGVFLSNGPGDPLVLKEEHSKIKELVEANVAMFAICLGHQLLSISNGYPTYKLDFGQHGGNHPVADSDTKIVEITAQNHNYNVPDSICEIAKVTHKNLFDDTIEGVEYNGKNIFSVQHHPEASPGPHDSKYIFKKFADRL